MGQFDQTARPLSKMDGLAFFGWGLACSGASVRLSFVRWDDTRRLDWSWPGSALGTCLAPFVVDVASEDAAGTMAKIEAGTLGLPILPYVPLMRGGSEPAVIRRWPLVAEREADVARRVQYRDAA